MKKLYLTFTNIPTAHGKFIPRLVFKYIFSKSTNRSYGFLSLVTLIIIATAILVPLGRLPFQKKFLKI